MIGIDKKIRVLVVDDSAFMRKMITDILNSEPGIQVVDTARNGQECLEKLNRYNPDIVTLDIEMPVMDGLTALAEIMKSRPNQKVIMLSSLTTSGAEETIKALNLGAADFVTKNSATAVNFDLDTIKKDLLIKVKSLSNSKIFESKTAIFKDWNAKTEKPVPIRADTSDKLKYIVAIGTSTGGPRSLQEVIPLLPENLPAAVLIVQHMPPGFTKSLSERLDSLSNIKVKEAEDGDVLKNGWVYIAPGDYHMLVNRHGADDYRIAINQDAPVTGHRPSVNAMMDSVASCGHKSLIAVMMTGMGNDGTIGIKNIKEKGGKTIAQNEETCVVYGMPKSAVNAGAIDKIVPLQDIAKEIQRFMGV